VGALCAPLTGHGNEVTCVAMCAGPGGLLVVASGSRDRTVRLLGSRSANGGLRWRCDKRGGVCGARWVPACGELQPRLQGVALGHYLVLGTAAIAVPPVLGAPGTCAAT
jgi:hypothetical protein